MSRTTTAEKKETGAGGINRGFALTLTLLAMTSGAMSLNKVAPIATTIATSMGLPNASSTGLLISVFTLSGIFLSLPIGTISARVGCYRLGLLALGSIVVGSVIGSFEVSYPVMLVSRVIEGIGLVCLATVGPTIVGTIFTGQNRGKAMGLLMCYMAFGQIIMLNAAPLIAESIGWKMVWVINAVVAAVLFVVWLIGFHGLDAELGRIVAASKAANPQPKEEAKGGRSILSRVLHNRSVILVALSLMFYIIAEQATMGSFSNYLTSVRGMNEATAGFVVSIASIIGIPVGILTGVVTDKLGKRKVPLIVLLAFGMVLYGATPLVPTDLMWLLSVLRGFAVMGVVGIFFTIGSDVVEPDEVSASAGLLNTFQYIGLSLSTFLFGIFVDLMGWELAFFALMPFCVVGILCIVALKGVK